MLIGFSFLFKKRDSKDSHGTGSLEANIAWTTQPVSYLYLALAAGLTWSCLFPVHAIVTAVGATTTAAHVEIDMKAGEQEVTKVVLF